ncbi:unnamed protein product [Leptidea sinapis]|uniref:Ig-like domain-containing protein n=1 Tax=Leptidea sinapis TaxID=189913 RepID=A0A5E4R0C9_9NEOP|nr:unnamed protein product [Leptidea sinapis]
MSTAAPSSVEIVNHPHNSKLEVKEGDDVVMECQVNNAKPAARIVWYRGNQELKGDRVTSEDIREVGSPTGNPKSIHQERHTSRVMPRERQSDAARVWSWSAEAVEETLQLSSSGTKMGSKSAWRTVAPSHVTISGPSEARVGDPVPLSCTTAPSNPAAEIKWLVLGKQHRDASNRTVISPEDPPSAPMITGYIPGTTLAAGTVQKLSCISSGGNPLATLTWFKNDKKVFR